MARRASNAGGGVSLFPFLSILANIQSLRKEQPALEKNIAALRAELARRKVKPDNKPVPIQVQPGGTGSASVNRVSFVERDSTGIILHRKDGAKTNVSLAATGTDQNYNRFLDESHGTQGSMVLSLHESSIKDSDVRFLAAEKRHLSPSS